MDSRTSNSGWDDEEYENISVLKIRRYSTFKYGTNRRSDTETI